MSHPERVAIVGSREFPDLEGVRAYVRLLRPDSAVISGGARGVDVTAENAAGAHNLMVVSYRPAKVDGMWRISRTTALGFASEHVWLPDHFTTFARAAYFRNGLIVDDCTRLVAFWDGESRGTHNSIRLAEAAGKAVHIVRPA